MRILVALPLLLALATPLHAQESRRNAWGLVAAPMTYEPAGTNDESNTSLDIGVFYSRYFTPRVSGRIEMFAQSRHYPAEAPMAIIPWPYQLQEAYLVDETGFEVAFVLSGDRRIDLAGHEARFSMGIGGTITAVFDQSIRHADPGVALSSVDDPSMGTYGKFGWLFDGGMALALDPSFGVFARFRVQRDVSTFSESDDADIVRELAAFGFHVGAEFGF